MRNRLTLGSPPGDGSRTRLAALRSASLGTKIGVLFAVLMAAASSVAGVTASRQMSEMTHRAALIEGRAVLDALAIPAAAAIAAHDYPKLDNLIAELGRTDGAELSFIVVVDSDGKVMATSRTGFLGSQVQATGKGQAGFSAEFVARALDAEGFWYAFGPTRDAPEYLDISGPVQQGQRWGTLLARLSLAAHADVLSRFERWVTDITVLIAIGGWILAVVLLRKLVISPTRELVDMAQRIGRGELAVRAELTRKDEIGALGSALNLMAERLEAYTAGLEAAVRLRTRELEDANKALEDANKELERLATTDGLKGLKNHRFFQTTLEFEIKRGARRVHPLTLCMIDIDFFKKFNDTYGHPEGDEVLKGVGRLLLDGLRSTDVVARYGGEEFAVILLDTPPEEGFRAAQKIGQLFRERPFEGERCLPGGKLTVSIGVASYPEDARTPEQLVRAADLALYEAKRRGRNTVVRYTAEIPQHTGVTVDVAPASPLQDPIAGQARPVVVDLTPKKKGTS